MEGFLIVDKPKGWTSYDVIRKLKPFLPRGIKIGHTGTLDPLATGVLPIAIGRATKSIPSLRDDKIYDVEILLGVSTTTDDSEGEVLVKRSAQHLSHATIMRAIEDHCIGTYSQQPPSFSARHYGGKRLYELARAGNIPGRENIPGKIITVFSCDIQSITLGEEVIVTCSFHCSHGTYIRSIARDLGDVLGVGGHVIGLRRRMANGFFLTEAKGIEEIIDGIGRSGWCEVFSFFSPHVS